MLFFVSVGILFDPQILIREPLQVLVVAIIVFGNAGGIPYRARLPLSAESALMVSASLAQIGEFSFILAGLGVALGGSGADTARLFFRLGKTQKEKGGRAGPP